MSNTIFFQEEGEAQIQTYALDDKLKQTIENTQLIKLVIVFSGHEAVEIKAIS